MSYNAVELHSVGQFPEALQVRLADLATMAESDPERPHRLSEIALGYERLGNHEEAVSFADRAYEHEATVTEESDTQAALREQHRPAIALNVGIVYVRAAARMRLAGEPEATAMQALATEALETAREGLQADRKGWPRIHQHSINAMSRLAMNTAVEGRLLKASALSVGAVAVGFASESRLTTRHTAGMRVSEQFGLQDGLKVRNIMQSPKGRAIGRGLIAGVAVGLSVAARIPKLQGLATKRDELIARLA